MSARAVRLLFEDKGQWGDRFGPEVEENNQESDADPRASLITTPPWFRWGLEVEEEGIRLARAKDDYYPDYERAKKNVRARWRSQGDWKDTWGDTPGWKWRHESPSQEPEDPNDLDFSPSEIDALDAIAPLTPPPPPPPALRKSFDYPPTHPHYNLFGNLDQSSVVEQSEDPEGLPTQEAVVTEDELPNAIIQAQVPETEARTDATHALPQPTTTRLRKRKRNNDAEAGNSNDPSSAEPASRATARQTKRSRTANVVPTPTNALRSNPSRPILQSHARREAARPNPRSPVAGSIGTGGRAATPSGPRRSARIQERKGTSNPTVYGVQAELPLKPRGAAKKTPRIPPRRKGGRRAKTRLGT